ncbi:MAG TPA: hypothetical protein VIG64_05355 [Actinomycetota bacterium]
MSFDQREALRRLEEAVGLMRGVRGARADLDPSGAPSVRALVLPEVDEAAIDQAVRALARTNGIELGPGAVQILKADLPAPQGRSRRRKLSTLSVARSDEGFTAKVTLDLDGDALIGEIEAPAGRRFELRSIGLAVLDALSKLLEFEVQLESVNLLQIGDTRLAIVQLNTETEALVGSALVRYDEHDAIARATLDALNRLVGDRSRRVTREPVTYRV